jgi:hypothetical protein
VVVLLFVIFVVSMQPAFAGLADTPLPTFGGQKLFHLFSVPGVVKTSKLDTVVCCSAVSKKAPFTIGFEVFDTVGDRVAGPGFLGGGEGGSGCFATGLIVSTPVNYLNSVPTMVGGSMRITSTIKEVICSVFIVDNTNNPPQSMVSLSVVSKVKQKGD